MIKRKLRKWLKEYKFDEQETLHFNVFLEKLKSTENFSLSRFGDGEWNSILNVAGENCDGHQYFEDMGVALRNCFDGKRDYYMGIQPLSIRTMMAEITPYVKKYNQHFFNADLFHKASICGHIGSFFDALNERDVVLVGPSYLSDLKRVQFSEHILVPQKDCWLQKDALLKQVKTALESKKDKVVIFVASMASNVFVDILHAEYGDHHSFLDLGSLFDPYVGKHTRSYHKDLKV